VIVETCTGARVEEHVPVPLGHPSRPISDERLRDKFRYCCRHSATPIPAQNVEKLIETIDTLDRLDDVGRLATLASGN
jgi:2-methylcitrate dehydratase PrpD